MVFRFTCKDYLYPYYLYYLEHFLEKEPVLSDRVAAIELLKAPDYVSTLMLLKALRGLEDNLHYLKQEIKGKILMPCRYKTRLSCDQIVIEITP